MDDPPRPGFCADCGRPISPTATRCRACFRLSRVRHETIIPDCPFPPGSAEGEARVLTAAERWWIRTAGAGYTARGLARHFGVHPTTITRIRAGGDPAGDDAGEAAVTPPGGRVLPWSGRPEPSTPWHCRAVCRRLTREQIVALVERARPQLPAGVAVRPAHPEATRRRCRDDGWTYLGRAADGRGAEAYEVWYDLARDRARLDRVRRGA